MDNKGLNKNNNGPPLIIYLIAGIIALCFRLFFSFSQDLISGVNGGYYPLQVRSLLTNGHLAFPDMPLLFYIDALLIKAVSLSGLSTSDNLILNVVKITDSITIPLLLIPLYRIIRLSKPVTVQYFNTSIIAFSVLSFSPLILLSDLQKNALAIIFLLCCIAYFQIFMIKKEKFDILLLIIFLLLTALTHFGTFVFALLFLTIAVIYNYGKKAIIPLLFAFVACGGIIAILDLSRFTRLLLFWTEVFEKPAILNGMLAPPDFINILSSIFLTIAGIIILRTNGSNLSSYQKAILFSSAVCLLILSFPFLDGEYFKRLSLLLFIPQIFIILQIAQVISIRQLKTISALFFLYTALSIFAVTTNPKQAVINQQACKNLNGLKTIIKSDNNTIIISRHGLEWWIAWILKTKIAQDKAMDKSFPGKYKKIIFIIQTAGFGNDRQRTPFHEPAVPPDSELIFSSDYFKVYKLLSINQ